ncbi:MULTISPECIES: O-antigen translocase [unclassified Pseudomonas]|uniref:O-antigen translocase n=1 Tax=unclassified Pseudomonas TaxID=196821 RepID=UPI000C885D1E|nr:MULTISPECIES: O-antigen translocase [unclassified Pseudomonas]PMZ93584.1 O-antigen translocase [Pseudomonas sp. FW305-42]PNA24666.1 O-antigen translocase [Pseudomonas sp. MPR-R1B]PNB22726.1 O-antigen translocase [Pseudomonas sp. DP16D-E2]PNB43237.1 O-antigen translocase [Pseudomonas sp. FW305-17]PNB57286.1 O-antigen translocase [Pseudomonas sp. GW531-E2]
MTLIKTSLLNGISVIVRMLTLLGLNKILAIYVGPSGYAVLGQFQNAVQMITTFASGAINTGVTKYTAEYGDDLPRQREVWRTALIITGAGSVLSSLLIFAFSDHLAVLLMKDSAYASVFVWFAAFLLPFTLNALLIAILNGRKEIALYVIANIAGSLFSLLVTTVLAIRLGLYGALVALAVYQSLSFFVTLVIILRTSWFTVANFFGRFDKSIALNLLKFTSMALASAICVPLSQIAIREYIGTQVGWEVAGYWEAMWRLSAAYLMLVTTTLSVYFLPRFSELEDLADIRREIIAGYKIIVPVTVLCALIMYALRDFIIGLLFTEDFLPIRDMFAWQMLGDVLRICSWMLAYVFIAKGRFKIYIASEVLFAFLFYALTRLLLPWLGLSGLAMAHALNYAAYLVFMYLALKRFGVFK